MPAPTGPRHAARAARGAGGRSRDGLPAHRQRFPGAAGPRQRRRRRGAASSCARRFSPTASPAWRPARGPGAFARQRPALAGSRHRAADAGDRRPIRSRDPACRLACSRRQSSRRALRRNPPRCVTRPSSRISPSSSTQHLPTFCYGHDRGHLPIPSNSTRPASGPPSIARAQRTRLPPVLQSRVSDELPQPPRALRLSRPKVILDLGAGTGRAAAQLKPPLPQLDGDRPRWRARHVPRGRRATTLLPPLRARMRRRPPVSPSSPPASTSSSATSCCNGAIRSTTLSPKYAAILKPEGLFVFSTFGPDTLRELRSAWAEADTYNHVNRFLDMHDVGDALVRAGLLEPVLDVDRLQLTYGRRPVADARSEIHRRSQ